MAAALEPPSFGQEEILRVQICRDLNFSALEASAGHTQLLLTVVTLGQDVRAGSYDAVLSAELPMAVPDGVCCGLIAHTCETVQCGQTFLDTCILNEPKTRSEVMLGCTGDGEVRREHPSPLARQGSASGDSRPGISIRHHSANLETGNNFTTNKGVARRS